MSSIIQSSFIEPIVRQARKLTNPQPGDPGIQASEADAASSQLQSHANAINGGTQPTTAAPAEGPSTMIDRGQAYDEQNAASRLGRTVFDRFVPLLPSRVVTTARPLSAPVPARNDIDKEQRGEDNLIMQDSRDGHGSTIGGVDSMDVDMSATIALTTPERRILSDETTALTGGSSSSSRSNGVSRAIATPITRPRRSTRDIPRSLTSKLGGSLPADDGMTLLREKLHDIRELDVSNEEKARLMHAVMTEEFYASHTHLRPQSPSSFLSAEPGLSSSPMSILSMDARATPTSPLSIYSSPDSTTNHYNLCAEDLQPSFRPPPPSEPTDDSHASEDTEPPEPVLGCVHYKRYVKVQCYDCKRWYSCRHCHDEADPSHALNRRKTENMLCMLCWTPQPAAQNCRECGHRAAYYYCDLCKLWDDDGGKRIYHCSDCGICRRGEGLGKDFVHCKKCNVCISISHATSHHCIERATDCDCPICGDYMFTSPSDIVAMPCGHYLHHACYTQYLESAYKCPICKKSAVNMELQWRKLEQEIERQPMPVGLRGQKMEVKCNDCSARSVVPFHWLGCKCGACDGFNTCELRLVATDEGARGELERFVEGLEERRARQQRSRTASRAAAAFGVGGRARTHLLQPRDYFGSVEDDVTTAAADGLGLADRLAEHMPNLPNLPNLPFVSPYEMLARVSRSLSPIRHYFDNDETDGSMRPRSADAATSTTDNRSETLSLWGDGAWFFSSGGETDDEYESDEDLDEDGEGDEFEEEDESDSDEGELDIQLIGHR